MTNTKTVLLCVLATAAICLHFRNSVAGHTTELNNKWQVLEPGLELGAFISPRLSDAGDSIVRILRINPEKFKLRLLNASNSKQNRRLTAKQWSRSHKLIAAINASMYQTDYRTSVSLMRTRTHVNNPYISKDNTILAFDRLSPDIPLVKLIDRECDDFNTLSRKYGTLIQGIRMFSCKGINVWKHQPKKWSTAAIGIDREGRILFVHVRSPFSTHDLINILKDLPIGLSRAMYAEGGPEAQLYIQHGKKEYEFIRS